LLKYHDSNDIRNGTNCTNCIHITLSFVSVVFGFWRQSLSFSKLMVISPRQLVLFQGNRTAFLNDSYQWLHGTLQASYNWTVANPTPSLPTFHILLHIGSKYLHFEEISLKIISFLNWNNYLRMCSKITARKNVHNKL
jgi:hypothetical protein